MEDHNQVESAEGTESDSSNLLVDLNFEESRVLGSLIEKELTTPEYYPLTLNSLVSACNQKNNRLPKSNLDEAEISKTIEELRIKRLVHRVDLVGSRVPKFQHNAEKELDLIKAERALLSELLNRGPQTTGELVPGPGRATDHALEVLSTPPGQSKLEAIPAPPEPRNLGQSSSPASTLPINNTTVLNSIRIPFRNLNDEPTIKST